MHDVGVRQEIIDRVLARRGRYHLFDPNRGMTINLQKDNANDSVEQVFECLKDLVSSVYPTTTTIRLGHYCPKK